MALGLTSGGGNGDIKPFIKYDARAGRMFRVDRQQNGDGSFSSIDNDITSNCTFVADLANIRVGWVHYSAQGPVKRFVVLGKEAIPARPEDKGSDGKLVFKQGFEFSVALGKDCVGPISGAREFGSAAGCVIQAVDALHDAYSIAAEAKEGKLPVVKMTGATAVKAGQSTNYQPQFAIVGWVDRPTSLAAPSAAPAQQAAAPSTGSTQVAPPAAAPAPQMAAASADDFG